MESLWQSILRNDPEHPHWNALAGLSALRHNAADEAELAGHHAYALALNEEARAFDERALAARPNYALAYFGLARYHQLKGDLQLAIPLYQKALEIDPYDPREPLFLSRAYELAHDNAKAEQYMLQAIQRNPMVAGFHLKMARLLRDDHTPESDMRARQYIANALFIDPHNSEAHVLLGSIDAASANTEPEMELALAEFRTAMQCDPASPDARDGFARVTTYLPNRSPAQIQEALAAIQGAVDATHRQNARYLDALAMVTRLAGHPDAALAILHDILNRHLPLDDVTRQAIERHLNAWTQKNPPS